MYTPPSTPPTNGKKFGKMKFPTTPPPKKKHTITKVKLPETFPLTKSTSHESELENRVYQTDPNNLLRYQKPSAFGGSYDELIRGYRYATKRSFDSALPHRESHSEGSSPPVWSPLVYPLDTTAEEREGAEENVVKLPSATDPKSPQSTVCMRHCITHNFVKAIKVTTCDYCKKPMFSGVKCKECQFRCHSDCQKHVPPSCGLPAEYLDIYIQALHSESTPSRARDALPFRRQNWSEDGTSTSPFSNQDLSSKMSSRNLSTSSLPAVKTLSSQTPHSAVPWFHQFQFPADVSSSLKEAALENRSPLDSNDTVDSQNSDSSEKTVLETSESKVTDSEKTLEIETRERQISDNVDPLERVWPLHNSLSLREWDIPFHELVIGDVIGTGQFGTVYKGKWHGDVAIKLVNMDQMNTAKILSDFNQEVATLRKTRHENLVLFMGACMKPPHLAIVSSLCKGMTLYTHIHLRKDRFKLTRTIAIIRQILQGMSYLHARGIIHKDLKTKNIFLENGKVTITDFGLFSTAKLCYGNQRCNGLTIPPGWLCYVAPEIIRRLRATPFLCENDNLPFSAHSDVYAFGSVWYELLCGKLPFKGQPAEVIIWQVGKGMKQSMRCAQVSRNEKDILMMCWSFDAKNRPEFSYLLRLLEKIPIKSLSRSSSGPDSKFFAEKLAL